jgi:hypothetical protein
MYVMCTCPDCLGRLRFDILILCGPLTWRLLRAEKELDTVAAIERTALLAQQWAAMMEGNLVVS